MKPIPLTLIVASTSSNGIGLAAGLPWRLPKEMAYFARVTKAAPEGSTNAVVMGRKSWDSIPARWRPLAGRVNVVVSRQPALDLADAVHTYLAPSLPAAVTLLTTTALTPPVHRTFLIGGAQLYAHALSTSSPAYTVDRILLTRIHAAWACDVFFPDFVQQDGAWTKAGHEELCRWVGFEVPPGRQKEVDRNDTGGREVEYEFEMWVRG